MDSVSQLALGAAVGVAAMGRRTAVWKAALWGAVAGTLPDLDVLIDHGDPISNMVLHRAETHAPFWLTLFSLPFAAAIALKDVFERLPTLKQRGLAQQLPHNWRPANDTATPASELAAIA